MVKCPQLRRLLLSPRRQDSCSPAKSRLDRSPGFFVKIALHLGGKQSPRFVGWDVADLLLRCGLNGQAASSPQQTEGRPPRKGTAGGWRASRRGDTARGKIRPRSDPNRSWPIGPDPRKQRLENAEGAPLKVGTIGPSGPACEPASSTTIQWRRHLPFMLRIFSRKRWWFGIVHRSTVRRTALVGTTAVFGRSSTSGTSNINCLCDPETAKIVRTAANRLTSAKGVHRSISEL
jgi:hypothetical protein